MPSARELLQRFRPLGTPGAAAPAGVPVDRAAEASRELQPVFDELAATVEEVGRIQQAAAEQARLRRDRAAEEGRRIVEHARLQAEAQRAEAAARIVARAEQETAAVVAEAKRQAAEITRRADERVAGFVGRILAEVGRAGAVEPASAP